LKSIASPHWSYAFGDVVELTDDLAEKWVAAGIAAPVRDVEMAAKEPSERAVRKTAKRR